MARLFGTDGIRGVANVDLKPTLAYALGRATAHGWSGPGGAIVVGQDTRRSGDMFVAAITAGATSLGRRRPLGSASSRRRPSPILAGTGAVRGRDHGLGVAQPGRRQRPQGPRPRRAQARRRGRGRARAADLADRGARRRPATPSSGRSIDAARRSSTATASHRLGLAADDRRAGPADRPRLRERLGRRRRRRRSSRRPGATRRGHPRRARTAININVGCGATAPGVARGGRRRARRRRRLRPRRRRRPAASRSMRRGRVVDGDQVLGILALDRLARGALPGGGARRVGPVERRPPGGRRGGRRPGHPDAGRRQVHPRGDAGLGRRPRRREERPRHRPRAHHVGRRDRHRARGPAGDGAGAAGRWPSSPREIPLLPQQQRAVPARHKDQWEGDPVLQRAIADADGAARRRRPRSSSGRPAPSPRCGSWSRGRTRTSSPSWPTRSRPSRASD